MPGVIGVNVDCRVFHYLRVQVVRVHLNDRVRRCTAPNDVWVGTTIEPSNGIVTTDIGQVGLRIRFQELGKIRINNPRSSEQGDSIFEEEVGVIDPEVEVTVVTKVGQCY